MSDSIQRKITHRPKRQPHQADEEKHREPEDTVNHLFLGDQVHEEASHQERLATGDDQRDGNIDLTAWEMDVRCPHREHGANDQGDKNIQVPPHMVGDIVMRFSMGLIAHKSQ